MKAQRFEEVSKYLTCVSCLKEFPREKRMGAPKQRCAPCRKAYLKSRYKPTKPATCYCAICAKSFPGKLGIGRGRKYCSQTCYFESFTHRLTGAKETACAYCGIVILYAVGRPPKYCPEHRSWTFRRKLVGQLELFKKSL